MAAGGQTVISSLCFRARCLLMAFPRSARVAPIVHPSSLSPVSTHSSPHLSICLSIRLSCLLPTPPRVYPTVRPSTRRPVIHDRHPFLTHSQMSPTHPPLHPCTLPSTPLSFSPPARPCRLSLPRPRPLWPGAPWCRRPAVWAARRSRRWDVAAVGPRPGTSGPRSLPPSSRPRSGVERGALPTGPRPFPPSRGTHRPRGPESSPFPVSQAFPPRSGRAAPASLSRSQRQRRLWRPHTVGAASGPRSAPQRRTTGRPRSQRAPRGAPRGRPELRARQCRAERRPPWETSRRSCSEPLLPPQRPPEWVGQHTLSAPRGVPSALVPGPFPVVRASRSALEGCLSPTTTPGCLVSPPGSGGPEWAASPTARVPRPLGQTVSCPVPVCVGSVLGPGSPVEVLALVA